MVKLRRKFRGSTIIEVVVAMTLIVTTISLFFVSIGNINKSFRIDLKTYALLVVNSQFQNADSLEIGSSEIEFQSFRIIRTTEKYNYNNDIMILRIRAISYDDVLLAEGQRIFFKKSIDNILK
jgi:hypothetical protein